MSVRLSSISGVKRFALAPSWVKARMSLLSLTMMASLDGWTIAGWNSTLRERAIAASPFGQCSTVELRAHGTPDGIRTRNTFVISDVTAIFTTDREEGCA